MVADISPMQEDANTKLAEELSKIRMVESQEVTLPVKLEEQEPTETSMSSSIRECGLPDHMPLILGSSKPAGLQSFQKKGLFSVINFSSRCKSIWTYYFNWSNYTDTKFLYLITYISFEGNVNNGSRKFIADVLAMKEYHVSRMLFSFQKDISRL